MGTPQFLLLLRWRCRWWCVHFRFCHDDAATLHQLQTQVCGTLAMACVDDIAALLIDMPVMHRLSCFRDDIIFFIYVYQRWKYRVDKTRPTIWVAQDTHPACTDAPGTPSGSDNAGEGTSIGESTKSNAPKTE